MIDRALVEACYRAILSREAENEAVVLERLDRIDSAEDSHYRVSKLGGIHEAPAEIDRSKLFLCAVEHRLRRAS